MSNKNKEVVLPDSIKEILMQEVAKTERKPDSKAIFIALPTMGNVNIGLVTKLFAWARDPEIMPWFHFVSEKRHTDYARNIVVEEFLKSKCEYLLMIDHDVDPHVEVIKLWKHGKDIIAATVDCWINNQLLPSVWSLAACEQCVCVKKFMEDGILHDPSQYQINDGVLYRWNPDNSTYAPFASKEGILAGQKCRCNGTGLDPFVFQTYHKTFTATEIVKCDSLGSAALMIHRRVIEAVPYPWFRFYYKQSGEIMLTEDHYFCWKAAMLGYEIYADMNLQCSHFKNVDLAGIKMLVGSAFEQGRLYEKKNGEKVNIVVPTPDEVEKVKQYTI